jgi:hypothetical protein
MVIVSQSEDKSFPWLVTRSNWGINDYYKIDDWCTANFGKIGECWLPAGTGWKVKTFEQAIFLKLTWLS